MSSTFPAPSIARTLNVCWPSASVAVVCLAPGPLHGPNAPPSIRHSKVEPASLEEKPNVGVGSAVVEPSAGPEVIVVSGGSCRR